MYVNIANSEPTYPEFLSTEAVTLLKGLLQKNPEERLGRKHGIKEIRKSKFFRNLDWDSLLKRDPSMAPIKTSLKSLNFD